jgi:hypothetical protein
MSPVRTQEKILESLQQRLDTAILDNASPETLAALSRAVREATGALKDLKDCYSISLSPRT